MIVIVDYQMGNIGSIVNMLKRIKVVAKVSNNIEEISNADKLILPGVGSFDNGMLHLKKAGLIEVLNKKVLEDKTPILGICLGMQLLMSVSEEGNEKGLGWIAGRAVKFKAINKIKVPHMGWNIVNPKYSNTLYKNFNNEEIRFYFVHSYFVKTQNDKNILSTSNHGNEFVSSVVKNNIFGVQFHPEKSHKFGMRLLQNFIEEC